jgi:hypothetical protein
MRIRLDPGATPWQWLLQMDGRHVPGPDLGTGLLRKVFDSRKTSIIPSACEKQGAAISLCDVDGLIYRRHVTNCMNDLLAVQNSVFDVITRRMARTKGSKARIAVERPWLHTPA